MLYCVISSLFHCFRFHTFFYFSSNTEHSITALTFISCCPWNVGIHAINIHGIINIEVLSCLFKLYPYMSVIFPSPFCFFLPLNVHFRVLYLMKNDFYRRHSLLLFWLMLHFLCFLTVLNFIKMRVKDRPQCYFDVELNRDPGNWIFYRFKGILALFKYIFKIVLKRQLFIFIVWWKTLPFRIIGIIFYTGKSLYTICLCL